MNEAVAFVGQNAHGDPIAPVILGVTGILFFAVIGRFLARQFGQPTVLGELFMGIVLGNVAWYLGIDLITVLREGPRVFELVGASLTGASVHDTATAIFGDARGEEIVRIISGPRGSEVIQVAQTVDVFSRYGVIFMLFLVGLETEVHEMRRVGADSIRVAVIGVVVPFAFGFAAAMLLMPGLSLNSTLFVAATLGATSVGITANVLVEMDRHRSVEGRIILGAAICDDVLGLVILAVVSGIIVSGSVDLLQIGFVILMSTLFVIGAAFFGPIALRYSARIMGRLDIVEAKMFTSYLFVMLLAWIANLAGLATIVGAFAAGVVLSDSYFSAYENKRKNQVSIRELIMPLEVILVPIFFILMGIQVKLESFSSLPVLIVAGGLLVAAILGKLASGFGARRNLDRLVICLGMVPRGEVGLVFAAIGRALGVIDDGLFSAIVLMVMVTTLISPPLLKAAINRRGSRVATD
jgi:Kef-type K+ transport system membrane component KefB